MLELKKSERWDEGANRWFSSKRARHIVWQKYVAPQLKAKAMKAKITNREDARSMGAMMAVICGKGNDETARMRRQIEANPHSAITAVEATERRARVWEVTGDNIVQRQDTLVKSRTSNATIALKHTQPDGIDWYTSRHDKKVGNRQNLGKKFETSARDKKPKEEGM